MKTCSVSACDLSCLKTKPVFRWNRDIEGILKESGLKVEKVSRFGYYLGTIYWIEATPRSQYSEGQAR